MREVGIDISHREPKKIDLEVQLHADKAITRNCQGSCPYVLGGIEDWKVDDPAGQPLEKVRAIRDDIEKRVATWSRTAPGKSAATDRVTRGDSLSSSPHSSRSSAR
jgi:protein-tyrosine-phosphatase